MDIKKIKRMININTYLVTFEYDTIKGYRREQQRLIKGFEADDVKESFKEWANNIRTMAKVKILAIDELKEYTQEIEI